MKAEPFVAPAFFLMRMFIGRMYDLGRGSLTTSKHGDMSAPCRANKTKTHRAISRASQTRETPFGGGTNQDNHEPSSHVSASHLALVACSRARALRPSRSGSQTTPANTATAPWSGTAGTCHRSGATLRDDSILRLMSCPLCVDDVLFFETPESVTRGH